jgi:hypothetical protein
LLDRVTGGTARALVEALEYSEWIQMMSFDADERGMDVVSVVEKCIGLV